MEGGGKVWAPHPEKAFVLGTVVDIGETEITVKPFDPKEKVVKAVYDRVFPAEDDEKKSWPDNCSLMYLNEATLLHNIRLRYEKDEIYTYVANILIAVNPYHDIPNLYSPDAIKRYQGRSLGTLPPHLFAIGDRAFREMRLGRESQSIIVSGESGAGKTESTKFLLRYLTSSYQSGSATAAAGGIEQRIVEANPLLESFGNAKTVRNNNSSRFGKFVEVHYNHKFQVVGGHVSHYLLEKSRITMQHGQERNYHVFYRLCAGAPEPLRNKLFLSSPDNFQYLRHSCTRYFATQSSAPKIARPVQSKQFLASGSLKDPFLDDVADFARMENAMKKVGLSDREISDIFRVVAGVLHLGNINFDQTQGSEDGSKISANSTQAVSNTCQLLGFDPQDLARCLTSRMMQSGKAKGTVYMVPLKASAASSGRDALAKAIYSRLFDYIVSRVNQCFPFETSAHFIGVLDIAGFEFFQENSFEQFCINYCNEKLQQFFNLRTLKQEQALYEQEGLGVEQVSFSDNQDCIDLIEVRGTGIIDILNEEMKLPRPEPDHFTREIHARHKDNFRLATPRKSRLNVYKSWKDEEGFLVRHFAGAVCYTTRQFLDKNNDALHSCLEALVCESSDGFVQTLFENAGDANQGKLNFISVSSKFRTQLGELMAKLETTGAHFVRCIKPNNKMVRSEFESTSILSQLQCSGVVSVLKVMESGFPCRVAFADLYSKYKTHLPPKMARLDPRLFCQALFRALGLNNNDFKFGNSRIFFRPGKFAEFDTVMRSDPAHLAQLVEKVARWLVCARWKKAIYCTWEVIKLKNKIAYRNRARIIIQKTVRTFLAMRRFRPRYRVLGKVHALRPTLDNTRQIVKTMKGDTGAFIKQIDSVERNLQSLVKKLKSGAALKPADLDAEYNRLVSEIQATASGLQAKKKEVEEQERLRKVAQQMELERKRREEQEAAARAVEAEKRQRLEIEARRKKEEEEEKKREAARKKYEAEQEAQLKIKYEKEREEQAKLDAQLEQQKRDHELALRLAQEMQQPGKQISEESQPGTPIRPPLQRGQGEMSRRFETAFKKYDLSGYTYADLRDTINTSCDIELLEACREEFHRRLKVYHNWKARQSKNAGTGANQVNDRQRAPKDVADHVKAAQTHPLANPPPPAANAGKGPVVPNKAQRFFRVPFIRPCDVHKDPQFRQKGWWFAHFDGDWVARQLELHPNKPPILLVAGKDDMRMCELELSETGLTSKKGAEILAKDFEEVWRHYGGDQYLMEAVRSGQVRSTLASTSQTKPATTSQQPASSSQQPAKPKTVSHAL